MILQPTTDYLLIRDFMLLDEIWDRVCEEGCVKEEYFPKVEHVWLMCREGLNIYGFIQVCFETRSTLKMHIYILKKYRNHCREIGKEFYKWFLTLPPLIQKLNVSIPVCFRSMINFGLKMGMKQEGVNRKSSKHFGVVFDQINLGITREEIGEICG